MLNLIFILILDVLVNNFVKLNVDYVFLLIVLSVVSVIIVLKMSNIGVIIVNFDLLI